MQLTKADVYEDEEEMNSTQYYDKTFTPKKIKKLDFSKFLKVRKFYEDNMHLNVIETGDEGWTQEQKDLWDLYTESEHPIMSFKDWLFNHCFVDGLK